MEKDREMDVSTASTDDDAYLNENDVGEEYEYEGEEEEQQSGEEEQSGECDEFEECEEQLEDSLLLPDIGEPCTFEFHVHGDEPVYAVDFLQGSDLLATGAGDDHVCLLDARGCVQLGDLGVFGDSVTAVKFYQGATDALLLAAASMDGTIRIYQNSETEGVQLKAVLDGPGAEECECRWIDWHARGAVLAGGFADGSVWLWNVGGREPVVMGVFAGHVAAPLSCGMFTPDGKTVVTVAEDGSVLLLAPKETTPLARMGPRSSEATALAVHPASGVAMVGDADGHVRVFRCAAGAAMVADLPAAHGASVEALSFHPIGALGASGAMDGHVLVYDVPSFAVRHRLSVPLDAEGQCDAADGFVFVRWLGAFSNGPVVSPALSFGLLAGTARGRLVIWDGRSGHVLRRLRGRPGIPVLDASISGTGLLAVAFDDGAVSLYQL